MQTNEAEIERMLLETLDTLSVIHGWASLTLSEPACPEPLRPSMEIVRSTALRSARSVQDYLKTYEINTEDRI